MKIFFIVLIIAINANGFAQQKISPEKLYKIDSIWTKYKKTKHDSEKVKILIYDFGHTYQIYYPDSAIKYYNLGISLSEKNLTKETKNKNKNFYLKHKANALRGIGHVYARRGGFDDAIAYYQKSIRILGVLQNASDKIMAQDTKNILAECLTDIGYIYVNQGHFDKAIYQYKKALKIFSELESESDKNITKKSKQGKAVCNIGFGVTYKEQGRYEKALKSFLEALIICEEEELHIYASQCYANIGSIYMSQKNFEKALEYINKSLILKQKLNDKRGISSCYVGLGGIHWEKGKSENQINFKAKNYEQALEYYHKSIEIKKEIGDKIGIAVCYNNIGIVYKEMALISPPKIAIINFKKAIEYYKESIKIASETGDKNTIANTLGNIAELNIRIADSIKEKKSQMNHLDSAIYYGEKAYDLAIEIGAVPIVNFASGRLQQAYEKTGIIKSEAGNVHAAVLCFREALKFAEIAITTQDSMFNEEKIKALTEAEKKFESERKQMVIEEMEKQKKIDDENIATQRILILLITIGGLLLVVVAIMTFIMLQNRQKQKYKKEQLQSIIDTQENERIRFARDVHDGIGQYFFGLKLNISRLEDKNLNETTKNEVFKNTMKSIDDLQQEIRNISFAIMPPLLHFKGLIPAIEDLIDKINLNNKIQIELSSFDFNERLDSRIEIALYRIIQELITNAAKHSNATELLIQFTKHKNELNIMIEDDGDGFNPKLLDKAKGHGWKNIQTRLDTIQGTILIDSQIGRKGTTTTINIPV